jgi:GAF domain-containing protein
MPAAEVERALERIGRETSVSRLLHVACSELIALLEAERCVVSRIIGDLLVALSDLTRTGEHPALQLYLVSDFPLTQEVIDEGGPRGVVRTDPAADPAEVALLERIGLDSLLMLPLGRRWGLVELYGDEDGFSADQVEVAVSVVDRLGDLLAEAESLRE